MTKLWFQQGEYIYKAIIPQDSEDISDLITLIHEKPAIKKQLQIPEDCGTIKLFRSTGTLLDVGLTLQEFKSEDGYLNNRNHPIIVQIPSNQGKINIFEAGTELIY